MKIGGEFLPRPNALMFNKEQKELTREISAIIKELKLNKWIDELKIKWWIHKTPARKCHDHRRLYNGLTMKNIGGIFIVMAAGCMTTLVFMRCENWYYERKVVSDARKARLQAIQGPVKTTNSTATRKKSNKCNGNERIFCWLLIKLLNIVIENWSTGKRKLSLSLNSVFLSTVWLVFLSLCFSISSRTQRERERERMWHRVTLRASKLISILLLSIILLTLH